MYACFHICVISAVNRQFFTHFLKMLYPWQIDASLLISIILSSDPYQSQSGVLKFCVNIIFIQLVPREKMGRGGERERAGCFLVQDPCRSFMRYCHYSVRRAQYVFTSGSCSKLFPEVLPELCP